MSGATDCRGRAQGQPDWPRFTVRSWLVVAMACVAVVVFLAPSAGAASLTPGTTTTSPRPKPTPASGPSRPGTKQIGADCQFFFVFVYSNQFCKVPSRPDVGCFFGEAGGLSLFGFGHSFGHLYITRPEIFEATARMQTNVAVSYTNVNFLDVDSRTLGHFHGGGFPDLNIGIHGGVGRWRYQSSICADKAAALRVPAGIRRVK